MKLKKVKLKNFKGIKKFSAEFGDYVEITGDNGTGKTTIFDAFVWLLFDKDSHYNGTQSFDIKTLDKNNNVIHKLDHEVEGVFDTDSGKLQLRKVYKEKWVKKRGVAEKEFQGHTTDYFIDDVPVKKSEYDNKVNEIISEEKFKILTNPVYFNDELHWKDRRKTLMELSDFNEAQLLEKEKYAELDISGTPESYLKKLKHKQKKINDNLEEIPVRISELQDSRPESLKSADIIEMDIASLKEDKRKTEQKINNLNKESEKEKLEYRLEELSQRKDRLLERAEQEYKKRKMTLQESRKVAEHYKSDYLRASKSHSERAKELEKQMATTKADIKTLEQKEFKDSKCPTCGQELPHDQLVERRKKFNFNKSEKLEKLKAKKKTIMKDQVAAKGRKEELEQDIKTQNLSLERIDSDLKNLKKEVDNAKVKEIESEIEKIKNKLENLQEGSISEQKGKLRKEKEEIETKIDQELSHKANLEQQQKINKRIEELEKQQKSSVKEYDKLEKQIHLTEQFIEEKVRAVNREISKKFEMVKFKLFEKQINGGLKPVCKTLYKGVPWKSLNTGARINAGLDIVRTLEGHYKVNVPVWIDNRESITNILQLDTQIFNLVVKEGEPLKVESFAKAKE